MEFVLVPALDAPVLVFERAPLFTDVDGRVCGALPMLDEQRAAFRRVPIEKRPQFFKLLRNLWVQIVDQADGYCFPDDPQSMFEFAE